MIKADHQKQEFQGRLARIRKGAPNTLGQVYIGPAEDNPPETARPNRARRFSLILAFPVGALCYLIGSMVQYHVLAEDGLFPLTQFGPTARSVLEQFGDLVPASVALLIFAVLLRFRSVACWTTAMAGLFVMMGATQPLMAAIPDVYRVLFSESYVASFTQTDSLGNRAF